MRIKSSLALLLFAVTVQFIFNQSFAQIKPVNTAIVYNIVVTKNKHTGGLEETYNGGTKAIFVSNKKARIRLVSLMRIQSIFFDYDEAQLKKTTIIKESGKKKYLFRLTPAEWKLYNKKYDSLVCDTSFTDSMVVAGYPCRKAVITLEDEKQVNVFYTDSIHSVNAFIEPLFRCIPGTVLQYEFSSKKGTVLFKASEVSNHYIEPKIFTIPSKNVAVRKYYPNKKARREAEVTTEEDQ
ncbi:MAG: hypothetical protein IPP72_00530 [Chitinophagaceae bacterium]|nr:hypothetical protein [Chitinophagaceae bacterium]